MKRFGFVIAFFVFASLKSKPSLPHHFTQVSKLLTLTTIKALSNSSGNPYRKALEKEHDRYLKELRNIKSTMWREYLVLQGVLDPSGFEGPYEEVKQSMFQTALRKHRANLATIKKKFGDCSQPEE